MPDAGLIKMRDAESGARRWVDTGDRRVREEFQRYWRKQRQARKTTFIRCKVDIDPGPDRPAVHQTDRGLLQDAGEADCDRSLRIGLAVCLLPDGPPPTAQVLGARARSTRPNSWSGTGSRVHIDLHAPGRDRLPARRLRSRRRASPCCRPHPLGTPGPTLTRGEYVDRQVRFGAGGHSAGARSGIPSPVIRPPGPRRRTSCWSRSGRCRSTPLSEIKDLKPPLSVPITWQEVATLRRRRPGPRGRSSGWPTGTGRNVRPNGPGRNPGRRPRPAHDDRARGAGHAEGEEALAAGTDQGVLLGTDGDPPALRRKPILAMPALEETTDEILAGLRRLRFPAEMLQRVGDASAAGGPGEVRETAPPRITEHEEIRWRWSMTWWTRPRSSP